MSTMAERTMANTAVTATNNIQVTQLAKVIGSAGTIGVRIDALPIRTQDRLLSWTIQVSS